MSISCPLGAALCWFPRASCVRVLPCTQGSLSWFALGVQLQEAELAERLQRPQSLAQLEREHHGCTHAFPSPV